MGNQIQLLDAFFHQLARFGDDALDGAATVAAADLRDDAKRARMIAALGDFNVREMFWREPETRRVVVGDVGRLALNERQRTGFGRALRGEEAFDDRGHFGDLIESDKRVDFIMQRRRKIFGESLRHAAGHDELLLLAAFRHAPVLVNFEDVPDGLLLGGVDERARVDDHDVGLLGVRDDGHAGLM